MLGEASAESPSNRMNLDESGALTIIVQGGLFASNAVEVANNCRHWRELFPLAEIILSLSTSDILLPEHRPRERREVQRSGAPFIAEVNAAIEIIEEQCDAVLFASPQVPLPPIKSDSPKLNNINLQIAAAQNGLSHAHGRYVLRVRSDLIFLDHSFLDQYWTMQGLERGRYAAFEQRILISWLYTLNPYTHERMPFHFSDWFHFGLLEDVRKIWQAPFVPLRDAVYYLVNRHRPDSNQAERLMNIRVAVEQHVAFNCFQNNFPDLKLAYHNDLTSADASVGVLIDNFVLCDLLAAQCIFPKYAFEFDKHEKRVHCITPDDWRSLVARRNTDFRITLSHKIAESRDPRAFERRQGFPRVYNAQQIFSKIGRVLNGEIVANGQDGVVVFGPHVALPFGSYTAHVQATTLEGSGSFTMRLTLDHGRQVLAERRIVVQPGVKPDLTVPFEITSNDASDFEVVCVVEGLRTTAIAGLILEERDTRTSNEPFPRYYGATQLRAATAEVQGHEIVAASDGLVFAGPHAPLPPGRYTAAVNATRIDGDGTVILKALVDDGQRLLVERSISVAAGEQQALWLSFDLAESDVQDLELHCCVEGLSEFAVSGITISEREPDEDEWAFPRFYDASTLKARDGRLEGNQIVSTAGTGILCYGPYTTVPAGTYVAAVDVTAEGHGRLVVSVTADAGQRLLAKSSVRVDGTLRQIEIPFDVVDGDAFKFEVVCRMKDLAHVRIAGITLSERNGPLPVEAPKKGRRMLDKLAHAVIGNGAAEKNASAR